MLVFSLEEIEPKCVHRDIKSTNVLIDDDNAKISDIELAKSWCRKKSHYNLSDGCF